MCILVAGGQNTRSQEDLGKKDLCCARAKEYTRKRNFVGHVNAIFSFGGEFFARQYAAEMITIIRHI
jgi:hypothetical protein